MRCQGCVSTFHDKTIDTVWSVSRVWRLVTRVRRLVCTSAALSSAQMSNAEFALSSFICHGCDCVHLTENYTIQLARWAFHLFIDHIASTLMSVEYPYGSCKTINEFRRRLIAECIWGAYVRYAQFNAKTSSFWQPKNRWTQTTRQLLAAESNPMSFFFI